MGEGVEEGGTRQGGGELVAFAHSNDGGWEADFAELLARNAGPLRATCLRLAGGNEADADDLYQVMSIKAYRCFGSLEDRNLFVNWCRRIAANAWTDRCRVARHTESIAGLDFLDDHDLEEEIVDVIVRRDAIGGFVAGLSEAGRVVFDNRAQGVPAREVAQKLQVKPAAVDTMFLRLRSAGRRHLGRMMSEGMLAIGGMVPLGVRTLVRRRAAKVAAAVRRVDGLGASQLVVLVLVVGGAAGFGLSHLQGARRPPARAIVAASVGVPTGPAKVAVGGARSRPGVPPAPVAPPASPARVLRGCAVVFHCEEGPGIVGVSDGGRLPGDRVVYLSIPFTEYNVWLDLTPHLPAVAPSTNDGRAPAVPRPAHPGLTSP